MSKMPYAEIRKILREALDEINVLATSRHAGDAGDVNEQFDLLLRIQYVTENAIEKAREP